MLTRAGKIQVGKIYSDGKTTRKDGQTFDKDEKKKPVCFLDAKLRC